MISEQKLYIITRSDLSPGLQIAQSCHALREFIEIHPEIDKAWYKDSNYLVILSVNNEFSLELLIEKGPEFKSWIPFSSMLVILVYWTVKTPESTNV